MKGTWYEVLRWAAARGEEGPFSTIDVARELEAPGQAEKVLRARANSITQKLWKWRYIRKAVGTLLLPYTPYGKPKKRRPGRAPAVWVVTPKGLRRSNRPYVQKFFPKKKP